MTPDFETNRGTKTCQRHRCAVLDTVLSRWHEGRSVSVPAGRGRPVLEARPTLDGLPSDRCDSNRAVPPRVYPEKSQNERIKHATGTHTGHTGVKGHQAVGGLPGFPAHLKALEEDTALALHAHVLGPLHKAAHIALHGEGTANPEGLGPPLVERGGGLQGHGEESNEVFIRKINGWREYSVDTRVWEGHTGRPPGREWLRCPLCNSLGDLPDALHSSGDFTDE